MNARGIVLIAAVVGVIAAIVSLDAFETEEDRVRKSLYRMAGSFNDEKSGSVAKGFGESVRIGRISVDRESIRGFLAREFLNYTITGQPYPYQVEILSESFEVELEGEERAKVTFTYRFSRRTDEGEKELSPHTVQVELEKVEGEWLVISTTAERESLPMW